MDNDQLMSSDEMMSSGCVVWYRLCSVVQVLISSCGSIVSIFISGWQDVAKNWACSLLPVVARELGSCIFL